MTEEKGRVGKGNEKSGSARNEISSFFMLKYVFVTPLLTQSPDSICTICNIFPDDTSEDQFSSIIVASHSHSIK